MTDSVNVAVEKSSNVSALITAASTGIAGAITTIIIYIPQYLGLKPFPEQMNESILVVISALVAYYAHKKTT